MSLSARLLAAAGLLLTGLSAHGSTYTLATTQVIFGGSASGSISGTGTTLTGFDLTASTGSFTVTFDSSSGVAFGSIAPTNTTLLNGTPIEEIDLMDQSFDSVFIFFTGDFTSGLTPLTHGTSVYHNGAYVGTDDGFEFEPLGGIAYDDISLTLFQPASAVTPEPSSLVLLGSGVLGLAAAARRRFRAA